MIRHARPTAGLQAAPGQRGAALVVGLILLLVLTLLAISGMTTASLELLMAGNEQYQERAFQAADAGVEQALAAGIYNTNTPIGTYDNVAALNPVADRGTGRPIANCAEVASPTDAQQCEYFMRFDLQAGQTPVPSGGYSIGTGFEAYHFIVDSYGTSDRGAQSDHRQSFYIVGPSGG
ncbi:MAG: PilX N-terminal domain-containing pilus assembly protein [Steroidobacteraceae bacterium]